MKSNKVLITGAGGFIGSHLTEKLVKEGYQVRAFIHYNSKNSYGWLEKSEFRKDIEFVTGDIRDYDSVIDAVKGCNSIFHLAALIGIPYSYISPLAYLKTNTEGTYNILQSARVLSAEQVLITSTSETYGTAQYVPIDEKHPLVGQSPYSATKIAADQLAISYHRAFDLPVKIVRPFNTYGPRQSARAVIPTIITQILAGAKEIFLGNLAPTRDLTYVQDTADAFLAISKCRQAVGEVINVGMNEETSVGDLAAIICEIMNRGTSIITDEKRIRPEASEVERLHCNNEKILKMTNWRPKYDLRTGLLNTINWLENNIQNYKADIYNV